MSKRRKGTMDLRDIYWGDESAENDVNLLKYFIEPRKIERMVRQSKSIIVGRKGAGKSAIRKYLSDYMKNQGKKQIVIEAAPNYSFISAVKSDDEIILKNEIFYQNLWCQYLFKCAIWNVGDICQGKKVSKSEEYARKLAEQYDMTNADFIESLANALKSIKVSAGEHGEFGLDIERQIKNQLGIDTLAYHIKKLVEYGYSFTFIVDDLDLGWDNSEIANNLLLGLLSSINYMKSLVNNSVNIFVCVRNDMYDILMGGTTHSDKYRNCEYINWDDDSLIDLLTERLKFNYLENNEAISGDIFHDVFPEKVGRVYVEKWLLDRTLQRPRELIQLVRKYTESTDAKDAEKLKKAEEMYSKWKLEDLCTEHKFLYPGLLNIFEFWKKEFYRSKYHMTKEEYEPIIRKIFQKMDLQEKWFTNLVDTDDIEGFMKILYNIGFIGDFIRGGQGGNKVIYAYQEDGDSPRLKEIQIHPCFRKTLGVVERIRTKNN